MTQVATSIDSMATALSSFATALSSALHFDSFLLFGLVLGITVLAFWQKNPFLYLLAFIVDMIYGLSLGASNDVNSAMWVAGVIVAIIGTFCLFRVVVNNIIPRLKTGK